MKTKSEIVANWLPRYTGTPIKEFSKYILLVNFSQYVNRFAEWHGAEVRGPDRQRDGERNHHPQFRNGQRQRGYRDGPAGRGSPKGGALPRKVRRLETQKQTRRPYSSHRRDPRRRHVE